MLRKVLILVMTSVFLWASVAFAHFYNVTGSDPNGDFCSGQVFVDDDGGEGYVVDKNGQTIDIDVQWTSPTTLIGYDINGNAYDLVLS